MQSPLAFGLAELFIGFVLMLAIAATIVIATSLGRGRTTVGFSLVMLLCAWLVPIVGPIVAVALCLTRPAVAPKIPA